MLHQLQKYSYIAIINLQLRTLWFDKFNLYPICIHLSHTNADTLLSPFVKESHGAAATVPKQKCFNDRLNCSKLISCCQRYAVELTA